MSSGTDNSKIMRKLSAHMKLSASGSPTSVASSPTRSGRVTNTPSTLPFQLVLPLRRLSDVQLVLVSICNLCDGSCLTYRRICSRSPSPHATPCNHRSHGPNQHNARQQHHHVPHRSEHKLGLQPRCQYHQHPRCLRTHPIRRPPANLAHQTRS